MPNLVSFEKSLYENMLLLEDENPDAYAAITIDGYTSGIVPLNYTVCKIWMTKRGDIIVDWHCAEYQKNRAVTSLVREAVQILQTDRYGKD